MPLPDPTVVLDCRNLEKSFSRVQVLKGVSFQARSGEVLGLVGENGAGKSTLMNLIGGVHMPDRGGMLLAGGTYAPRNPGEAAAQGVSFVHQELNLFPNLPVLDNLFLTSFQRTRLGTIDRKAARERARKLLAAVELAADPETPVAELAQGERQLLEIARAMDANARVLMLDEPTTSLTRTEAERLFAMVERLRSRGMSVLYVSHALDDVLRICSRVVVLRDGAKVAEGPVDEFSHATLVSAMVGRAMDQMFPPRSERPEPRVALEARGLTEPGMLHDVSLILRAGEITGIGGLMGSGRSELARVLFGLERVSHGDIILNGKSILKLTPRERVRHGMAFVTESRREDGLFLDLPVEPNLQIVWPRSSDLGETAAKLRIRAANLDRQPVRQLSGGNQQKVALGKWLTRRPVVMIVDEPTRGIDVGAKFEIYCLLQELASQGVALLVISSEIEELVGLCDRVLVMRRGELRREFAGQTLDPESILKAAI